NLNGPFVPGGTYTVALVIDGKTVDTKPLKVADDPEVILTSVERKRQYDLAMEMHALVPRVNDATAAHASLTRQLNEISTAIESRNDVPADVKASLDGVKKDLAALAPKLTAPAGGRGGGGGRGNTENLATKVGQAKTGYMSGMVAGEQTQRAYTEARVQV